MRIISLRIFRVYKLSLNAHFSDNNLLSSVNIGHKGHINTYKFGEKSSGEERRFRFRYGDFIIRKLSQHIPETFVRLVT